MKKLKRNFEIFILFTTFSLRSTLQARLGILFFLAGKVVRFLLLFSLLFLIFGKIKMIKGYSFIQVAIFYLSFNIVDTVSQIIFREVYRFRPLVLSGDLDLILTKPYHPFLRILVGGVDFLDLVLAGPYFLLLFYFALKIGPVSVSDIFLYCLLLVNALLVACAFHIAALALGILTTEVDHTMMIYRDLTTLGRFPMEIYREPIRSFFTFVVPIGVMMSFPAKSLFHLLEPSLIVFAFLLSFILLFLSMQLWKYAITRYQSWGG